MGGGSISRSCGTEPAGVSFFLRVQLRGKKSDGKSTQAKAPKIRSINFAAGGDGEV